MLLQIVGWHTISKHSAEWYCMYILTPYTPRRWCLVTIIVYPQKIQRFHRPLGSQTMGWLWLVGSLKLYVSFAKEPYKREDILQKKPMILRSLLIVATPYVQLNIMGVSTHIANDVVAIMMCDTNMYIYIWVYVYMYTYIYIYIYIYVYVRQQYTYIYIYMYMCIYVYMYIYIYIYINIYV